MCLPVLQNRMDVYNVGDVRSEENDLRRCAGDGCPKRDRNWAGVVEQPDQSIWFSGLKN